MDFIKRNIAFLGIVVVTLVLFVGGVVIFSRQGPSKPASVSKELLVAENSYQTDASAAATLVEFGDYQCPACGVYHPFVKQLLVDFKGKLNFVFRNFPLSQHKNAPIASYAVEAAGLQGNYWEMHNKVFESQAEWSNATGAEDIFVSYAEGFGLDLTKFKTDINSQAIKDKVSRDYNDGVTVGINATPTYFLNGTQIEMPASYEAFKALVSKILNNP